MTDKNKHLLRLADWREEHILGTVEITIRLKKDI